MLFSEDCNKPSISDGSVSPDTTSVSSGAVYTATCNSGYILVGPAEITCSEGDLSTVPTCPGTLYIVLQQYVKSQS